MTGSAFRCWTLHDTLLLGEKFSFRKRGGVRGGDRVGVGAPPEGWRMTGSALTRGTFYVFYLYVFISIQGGV